MNLDCSYYNKHKCRSCSLLDSSDLKEIISKKQSLVDQLLEPLKLNSANLHSNRSLVEVSKLWSPNKYFNSRAKA